MSTLHNRKLTANHPSKAQRFNKREARASSTLNSLVETDADYTIEADDGIDFVANTGANTVTLPPAAESKGRCIRFRQTDANILTIAQNADGADIDGADADFTDCDAAEDWVELFCTGTEWLVTSQVIA